MISKQTKIRFCFFVGALLPAYGISLPTNGVQIAPGSRVAIMTGTYSPPHRRHHEIFEQLLASGLVDYVLVVPNDVTPHKPHALDPEKRLEMLAAAYKEHPKIIYPHSLEVGYPLASKSKAYLDAENPSLSWIGVMGKDSSQNTWAKIGARFQDVSEWIVLSPQEGDEASIPNSFGKTKVTRLYAPTENDVHSKEIRSAAANGNRSELEELLLPEVAAFVLEEKLYREPEARSTLGDYVGACLKVISKFLKK